MSFEYKCFQLKVSIGQGASRHFDGCLTLGHSVLNGSSSKEIFFSSYLCHPSMANND